VNWRWYIPILLIVLTFFGVKLEQSALPNQEIVVQFNAEKISDSEAQQAIARITSQLKSVGVKNVVVSQIHGNRLKVTYYSTTDVATIENLFKEEGKLQLDDTAFNEKQHSSEIPFSKNTSFYKVDVIKLQKDYSANSGLQGLPIVVKSAKDTYLKPITSLCVSETVFHLKQREEQVAFKNYRSVSILIDTTSHKIPEVRAGPLS
jgi:preprotein translocase subunit SecD